jgi:imidazoleglycerol-phosphate dehydratase
MRSGTIQRKTKETDIAVTIGLDGTGKHDVRTPLPFLTHMVEQLAKHGLFDLDVRCEGDVEIDGHHTTEDLGITLGQALAQALGDRRGIRRYGWALLPMDEARVSCTLDLSGRPFFVWEVPMPKAKIGTFDTELAEVFFEGFARGAACNLHVVKERGENLHHIVEITFKTFAKALEAATRLDPRVLDVPSTKGTLTL